MVQLDMVGQGRGYYLDMHGEPQTAGELLATLSLAAQQTDVRASVMGPMGASDHAPFQEHGVAAALLTWRDGQELHLPTDTPDLLDPRKLGVAGKVAAATLRHLADWAYVEERAPAMAMDGALPWPALTPTVLPAPG
jgi:Zn-dependent M28 family amino/carboxypeptidase